MQCEVSSIRLVSGARDQLVHFLSALFDCDLSVQGDEAILSFPHCSLKVCQAPGRVTKKQSSLATVEFCVSGEQELFRLAQKIEFLNYRTCDGKKKNEISFTLEQQKLSFVDFDGREWHITARD